MGPSGYSYGPSGYSMVPPPMGAAPYGPYPPQQKSNCCCIWTLILLIIAVTGLALWGLWMAGYIFVPENPDKMKATSLKEMFAESDAYNKKRAKLKTKTGKRWKIHKADPAPCKSFYTPAAHWDPAKKKKAPGKVVALPNKQTSTIGRLIKGAPPKKEWWFCGDKCQQLYNSGKLDDTKLVGREREIEKRYGAQGRKRQKLCLVCMHTNDTHRAKGRDGCDIDVESSDDFGDTADDKRERAITAVLKKGVTVL